MTRGETVMYDRCDQHIHAAERAVQKLLIQTGLSPEAALLRAAELIRRELPKKQPNH